MIQAVILCGGRGTRLREETEFRPKPLVTIGDRPILWHIMQLYRSYGVRDFVLCLGYKGELIRDYFLNYRRHMSDIEVNLADGSVTFLAENTLDWRVRLIETGVETLTGARIRCVAPYLAGECCFVTYGDGLADIDIAALLAFHRSAGKLATVTAVRPPSRFGEISMEGQLVRSFIEKPQTGAGWINGGFMVFQRTAIAELPDAQDLSLEVDVLEHLAKRDELAVFTHEGFWQCMDTFREMEMLERLWRSGTAPWKTW